jgi:hypothetical protein
VPTARRAEHRLAKLDLVDLGEPTGDEAIAAYLRTQKKPLTPSVTAAIAALSRALNSSTKKKSTEAGSTSLSSLVDLPAAE